MRQIQSWIAQIVRGATARAPEPLVSLARRARRLLAPLMELPVPLNCYEGRTPTGIAARVLVAGNGGASRYFLGRIFENVDACRVNRIGRVALFALPRTLRRRRDEADITLAEVDRLTSGLLFGDDYLHVPAWLLSTLPVPDDIAAIGRRNKSIRSDINAIRRSGFWPRVSHDPADLDRFYHEMYLPFARQRHGSASVLRGQGALSHWFRRGGILWIMHDQRPIAGALYATRGRAFRLSCFGTPGGAYEPVNMGAMAAAYLFSTELAKAEGFTLMDFGGTRPCARDGVFVFKRKWGTHFSAKPEVRHDVLVRWRQPGAFATEFLDHSPLLFRDGNALGLAAAAPGEAPDRARDLIWSEGVRRMFLVGTAQGAHPPDTVLADPLHGAVATGLDKVSGGAQHRGFGSLQESTTRGAAHRR